MAGPPEGAVDALLDALADPGAPTTVHDRARARDVHVADSLSGLVVPEVAGASVLADLGSGAGLPGLVLAAALPDARVFLVEAARRKADWIRETAMRMGLDNAEAVWSRAESWEAGRGAVDVVTARALAALPVLCEYAAPLLRDGGALVCWKGAVDAAEAADGRHAAALLGLSAPDVVPVAPYPGSQRRALWVFHRVGPLPPGFPRRPGMATKRPLSASSSGQDSR